MIVIYFNAIIEVVVYAIFVNLEEKQMKSKRKTLIIILIVFLVVCILGYICIKIFNPTMKAVVLKVHENSLLVMDEKDRSLLNIDLPKDINLQFEEGQEVLIYFTYDTVILSTYPGFIDSEFIKNIKILNNKSNIEIPVGVLQWAYNSRNNINVYINEFSETGMTLTITDTNPYKGEHKFSSYGLLKTSNDTNEILTAQNSHITSIKIDDNTFKSTFNWEDYCGKLVSGKYKLDVTSSYISLYIDFIIDEENGKIAYTKPIIDI